MNTMPQTNRLPDFLIVGAAKSGTTSLWAYLKEHPEIFLPEYKEPAIFEPKAGGIGEWSSYCKLFENTQGYKRIGEASVSYLMSPNAPKKIIEALGRNIDIIIILRNPIYMAYSLWGHMVREGYEKMSFVDALNDEPRRLHDPAFVEEAGRWIYDLTYIERASYYKQVKRYIESFGKERIHLYFFEEFFHKGLPQYHDLLACLGVGETLPPENNVFNKAGTVRSSYLRRVLSERMVWKEPLKLILPLKLRERMMSFLARYNRVERSLPLISIEAKKILINSLSNDVAKLSQLIGRDVQELWDFEAN